MNEIFFVLLHHFHFQNYLPPFFYNCHPVEIISSVVIRSHFSKHPISLLILPSFFLIVPYLATTTHYHREYRAFQELHGKISAVSSSPSISCGHNCSNPMAKCKKVSYSSDWFFWFNFYHLPHSSLPGDPYSLRQN